MSGAKGWGHRTRTAWIDWAEWVNVYCELFPNAASPLRPGHDAVCNPIVMLLEWRSRAPLQHAVSSTLDFTLLLSKLQRGSHTVLELHETRLAFAAAIVRFVNGACDPLLSMSSIRKGNDDISAVARDNGDHEDCTAEVPERDQEQTEGNEQEGEEDGDDGEEAEEGRRRGAEKRRPKGSAVRGNGGTGTSILALAKRIGIPSFLVALRHSCTHSALPVTDSLIAGASAALDWCRMRYWNPQFDLLVQNKVVNPDGTMVHEKTAVLQSVPADPSKSWVLVKSWKPCPLGSIIQAVPHAFAAYEDKDEQRDAAGSLGKSLHTVLPSISLSTQGMHTSVHGSDRPSASTLMSTVTDEAAADVSLVPAPAPKRKLVVRNLL
eukprot:ANDGO_04891.mRNA.1 hypothetical protein